MLKAKVSRLTALRFSLMALVVVLPVTWVLWVAHAATRTWTGGSLSSPTPALRNNLWNNELNWSGNAAPVAGDDLTFPSASQQSSNNNFANETTFNSITVSAAHLMQGNSVSLNAGISATAGQISLASIKLNNNQTFNTPTAGTGALITSAIDNNGNTLTLNGAGNFVIAGIISGTGGLTKTGAGTSQLLGNNAYKGTTTVSEGTLLVFGTQTSSFASISSGGTLGGAGTVGSINVNSSSATAGKVSPGGVNHGAGILSAEGNVSFLGTGVKGFDIDLNTTTVGSGYDRLKVKGNISLGTNTNLNVSAGFTPSPGATFLIIDNEGLSQVNGAFVGHPEGSMFTVNDITFWITYHGGDGNDVVLSVISGVLSFTASNYTAQEGVGLAEITLSRTGGGNNTAIAKVTLTDGTTSPADYFPPGTLDDSFAHSAADNTVNATALQADGKIIIAGDLTAYNGTPRNSVARVNVDGSLDATFDPGAEAPGQVNTVAVQADGKIVVGGGGGHTLVRFNSDGSLDTATFNNAGSGPNQPVQTIALQADSKIIIGGDFTNYNGTPRNRIARLNADGSLDPTFDPGSGAPSRIATIALQADGKIVIGGGFTTFNGSARNRIARLNPDGSLDTTFNNSGTLANSDVRTTTLQADGRIIIGGAFTDYDGIQRNRIARLEVNGTLDATFDPGSGASGPIHTTAVQVDGKIVIGGSFNSYNSTARSCIARLNANGSLDATFNPGSGFVNSTIVTTAIQGDGKIIIGGFFTFYYGTPRSRIARVDGDLFATWGPNDFTNKTVRLPLVSDGLVEGDETLGLTLVPLAGAVALQSAATLTIVDVATRRWDGGSGVDSNWQTKENWENDVAPVPGDDLVFPTGAARLTNTNNFAAGTTFNSITFLAAGYEMNGNAIALNAGITTNAAGVRNLWRIPIKLNSNQTFTTDGAALEFQSPGQLDTKGRALTFNGSQQHVVGVPIIGTGSVIKTGTGATALFSASNNYTGTTTLFDGFLAVNNQSTSITVSSGTFFGSVTTGAITANGGAISPGTRGGGGPFNSGSGILNAKSVFLGPPVSLLIDLRGTTPGAITGHDQLNVTGTIALGAPLLTVALGVNYIPATGDTFVIVNNDGADAVQGTFQGLPEGSIFLVGARPLRISYAGGDGNDVVLTATDAPSSIQFSAANYGKNESGPSTNITVTRTGDTSGPAAVDFRTGNNSFVPCTAVNGVTTQNCDFVLSSGTLNFAAGQASRSFPIIIIDDLYVEGNETLSLSLSNPVGAVLGTSTATLTIVDNDSATPATNPLDDARYFVRQHYYDFLGRLPDDGGLDYWTNEIEQCGSNTACVNDRRIGVSNAFFFEQEYQQTASFVFLLYRASFGNDQPFPNPDFFDANLSDSLHTEAKKLPRYLSFVRDRVQVVGGTDLAQSQLALANAFVLRPEFVTKYPLSLTTAAQFVDAVLATIRNDSGAELGSQRDMLIGHFNTGGRGLVMFHLANDYWNGCNRLPGSPPAPCVPLGFGDAVDNRPFIDAEYNRSFVYSQYSGYLRRDGDIAGFLFWLNQVSTAPPRNVDKQHAMVCSFITSTEYQNRFSSIVTHTNGECGP